MALNISRPIVLKAIPAGFKITDGAKRDLAYVYVEENEANALATGRLSPAEGKELATAARRFLDDQAKLTEG